jgi:CheY-like chemotaxis protein
MYRIALIEDEEVLRTLIAKRLVEHGYEVGMANDGEAGWELIKTMQPDLILLDLIMPKMTGYDVLEALRANEVTKTIPCVVISNSGQFQDLNRAYSVGADEVLIKANFDPDEVVEKVGQLLARRLG